MLFFSAQVYMHEAVRTLFSPRNIPVFAGSNLLHSGFYGPVLAEILGGRRWPGLIGEVVEGWGSRGDCQPMILEDASRDGRASVGSQVLA